jgi:hypothetical protein
MIEDQLVHHRGPVQKLKFSLSSDGRIHDSGNNGSLMGRPRMRFVMNRRSSARKPSIFELRLIEERAFKIKNRIFVLIYHTITNFKNRCIRISNLVSDCLALQTNRIVLRPGEIFGICALLLFESGYSSSIRNVHISSILDNSSSLKHYVIIRTLSLTHK